MSFFGYQVHDGPKNQALRTRGRVRVHSLDTRWKSVTDPHKVEFTDKQIAAAEYHIATVLDWTMGAALPSRFF
jgi:hypothetical protein